MPNAPIRHGEVLLRPIDEIPAGDRTEVMSCIVGHSETGHHHVLSCDESFWQIVSGESLYIELPRPGTLEHLKGFDQHQTLDVPPGKYQVIKKTEYNPFTKLITYVVD